MSLQVPQLPPVIAKVAEELLPKAKQFDAEPSESDKLVIILHSRDVGDAEETLCRKYGKFRHWNPSMANRPLETIRESCDYLFVDIRDKYARTNISKVDVTKYKWCAYANVWEKLDTHVYDDFIDEIHIITKFPDMKVTYKSEYDDLLTEKKKIKSPSSCLSLLSFLVNIWSTVRKE
jgi:hypothetical protein